MTSSLPNCAPATLRRATPEDAPALTAFARAAFVAAFGTLYRPEDLAAFFAQDRSAESYAAKLADPATRVALAEQDGRILAYCLIVEGARFPEHPEPLPERPMFLSQLYCAGEATGRGLGAQLLAWAIGEAREWGADAITLSVYSENHGAQRFYQRHGFRHIADIHFMVGEQRDDEFLYELRL